MHPMRWLLSIVSVAFLVGCGTPSIDSQISRYKKNIDQVDVLSAKQPQLKPDIERKRAEFNQEFEAAKAKGGEAGAKELLTLNGRVETWLQSLQGTAAPGTAGGPTNTQPGGKLGGPANGAPPANAGQPAGSGFGGQGAQPTPQPAPQPTGKLVGTSGGTPQPAGGSGFGNTGAAPQTWPTQPAPTPTPAPAPTPAPQGGSGFGGK